jgi:hypothetical protein
MSDCVGGTYKQALNVRQRDLALRHEVLNGAIDLSFNGLLLGEQESVTTMVN